MAFNFAEIKKVLKEAGHIVSEGEQFLVKDMKELTTWAHLHLGLSPSQVQYGLAYPAVLPTTFPGHPDASTPAPAAAATTPAPAPTASAATAPAAPVAAPAKSL